MSKSTNRAPAMIWLLAIALAVAACSGVPASGVDKVAGADEPIVLTMADLSGGLYHNPALQLFVDDVAERSGGSIQIEVVSEWGGFADGVEKLVVDDVASGKADVAWLPTRAFETMGLHEFRALNAPMLIDSYAVQEAVLASDIPAEMLPGLDQLGVSGLAMLADGLRKPISVEAPLLTLEDYDGITFTSTLSDTHAESISALGANAEVAIAQDRSVGLRNGEIQGFEMNLLGYRTNDFQYMAPYVAANVNLWASPIVLFANPQILDGMDSDKRESILAAAANAAEQSGSMVDVDSSEMDILCDVGARFADATPEDLASMRQAFQPVYASLAENATTAGFISRIEEIKAVTEPEPGLNVPAGCTGESTIVVNNGSDVIAAGSGNDGRFAGRYRWELTRDELLEFIEANGSVPELEYQIDSTPWLNTMTLTDREWTLDVLDGNGVTFQAPGTYSSDGETIVFDDPVNRYQLEFAVTQLEDGSLKLEPGPEVIGADRFVWASKVWQQVEDAPGDLDVTDLSGTYRFELTEDALAAFIKTNGPVPELTNQTQNLPSVTTIELDQGEWRSDWVGATGDTSDGTGTYTVGGDRITFDWPSERSQIDFTFTRLDDGSLKLEPGPEVVPADRFIWANEVWQLID